MRPDSLSQTAPGCPPGPEVFYLRPISLLDRLLALFEHYAQMDRTPGHEFSPAVNWLVIGAQLPTSGWEVVRNHGQERARITCSMLRTGYAGIGTYI